MTTTKAMYSWREGYAAGRGVSPQLVGQEVERLRKGKPGGLLDAEDLLEAAVPTTSPLHRCFEWDDRQAAHRHRLNQAREMLRALIVTVPSLPVERGVRAFVNVIEASGERGYTSMVTALADEELRAQILRRAFRELQTFQKRYEEYEELAAVMRAIEQTTKKKRRRG